MLEGKQTLVTIIVPAYNAEKYLGECLQSLVNQDYSCIEVLVIDDGSSDNTINISNSFSKIDDRVQTFSKQNSGPGPTRNFGLKHAHGEYVLFVDADDQLKSGSIRDAVAKIQSDQSDILVYDFSVLNTETETITNRSSVISRSFPELDISTTKECLCQIYKQNLGNYVWSMMYRTNFLLENNIFFTEDVQLLEDVYFMHRLLSNEGRVSYLSKPLYLYRRHSGSMTKHSSVSVCEKSFEMISHIMKSVGVLDRDAANYFLGLLFYLNSMLSDLDEASAKVLRGRIQKLIIKMSNELPLGFINKINFVKVLFCRVKLLTLLQKYSSRG